MKMIFNIWSSIFDMIAPRACTICGKRLSLSEAVICATCNLRLNRTNYHLSPYDNELARCFWGKIPIERCAAYLFYQHHTQSSKMVYALKYGNRPDIGVVIGKTIAEAYARNNFLRILMPCYPYLFLRIASSKEDIIRAKSLQGASVKQLICPSLLMC